jgi:hypothetical protein
MFCSSSHTHSVHTYSFILLNSLNSKQAIAFDASLFLEPRLEGIVLSHNTSTAIKHSSRMEDNNEKVGKTSGSDSLDGRTEIENISQRGSNAGLDNMKTQQLRANINAKIANPLAGFTREELYKKGEAYAREHQMGEDEDIRAFQIGAQLAQNPNRYDDVQGLTDEERAVLSKEISNKWSQPWLMYLVIILCSTCAAVQGMGRSLFSLKRSLY